jgi:superfamily II DNA helicase RecQ
MCLDLGRVCLSPRHFQVFHLNEAGVECAYFSSGAEWETQRVTFDKLRQEPPGIKILFITPEKVAKVPFPHPHPHPKT